MEPTKERILHAALDLFSQKGYDAVSVAQIAEAVGIKAPSLYKHYKSKQDIFQAILTKMNERYLAYANQYAIHGTDPIQDQTLFEHIDLDMLKTLGKAMFTFFLHDEYQMKFRKMLVMEQFHNPTLAQNYMKQYYDDALAYQGTLFARFMEKGLFIQADPNICALHFFGPIFLLLSLCDAQPERAAEVMRMLEAHMHQFALLYDQRLRTSL